MLRDPQRPLRRRRVILITGFAIAGVAVWFTTRPGQPLPRNTARRDQTSMTMRSQSADAGVCDIVTRQVIVRGHSLGSLATSGTRLQARFGYYACHPVQRGDLVWVQLANNKVGAAKVVQGVPGDHLAVTQIAGQHRLLINDQAPVTSTGEPYYLDRRARRLLEIYAGPLPNDAYLVLADRNERVIDARRFGLVQRKQLLARLERPSTPD